MARRLFEQPDQNNPDTTKRIAFGKAGNITENIRLDNFVTWLLSVLGFLKVSENLNDVNSKTASRTNLGVYSVTQVDNALSSKANSSDVLTKTNTTTYTPATDYHPSTKAYSDSVVEASESITFSSVNRWVDFSAVSLNGKKIGNIYHITATFESANSNLTPQILGTIVDYTSPGYDVYFVGGNTNNPTYEGSHGYIDTSGVIRFAPGKGGGLTFILNEIVIV